MRVRFSVDSGANINSRNTGEWFDPVEELGMEEGEWEKLSDDEKYKQAAQWANESGYLEIFFEEKGE